jgi:hypothetical protein
VSKGPWVRTETSGLADLERHEQARTVTLYRTVGCKVYNLSQYRRANQTPGLPDLLVKHGGRRLSWTHELKAKKGRVSAAQQEFLELCALCGDNHLVGGYDVAVAFLVDRGLLLPENLR